jgi:hypothetical protein
MWNMGTLHVACCMFAFMLLFFFFVCLLLQKERDILRYYKKEMCIVHCAVHSNNVSIGFGYTIYERTCTRLMQYMGRTSAQLCRASIATGHVRRSVDVDGGRFRILAGRNFF